MGGQTVLTRDYWGIQGMHNSMAQIARQVLMSQLMVFQAGPYATLEEASNRFCHANTVNHPLGEEAGAHPRGSRSQQPYAEAKQKHKQNTSIKSQRWTRTAAGGLEREEAGALRRRFSGVPRAA